MPTHPFDNPYDEEEPAIGDNFWTSQTTTRTAAMRTLDDALRAMREQLANPEVLRRQMQQEAANLQYLRGTQWIRWTPSSTTDG